MRPALQQWHSSADRKQHRSELRFQLQQPIGPNWRYQLQKLPLPIAHARIKWTLLWSQCLSQLQFPACQKVLPRRHLHLNHLNQRSDKSKTGDDPHVWKYPGDSLLALILHQVISRARHGYHSLISTDPIHLLQHSVHFITLRLLVCNSPHLHCHQYFNHNPCSTQDLYWVLEQKNSILIFLELHRYLVFMDFLFPPRYHRILVHLHQNDTQYLYLHLQFIFVVCGLLHSLRSDGSLQIDISHNWESWKTQNTSLHDQQGKR